jgi:hypothetical protein
MKTYKCIIIETAEFEVDVEANNEDEARESALDLHVGQGVSTLIAVTDREVAIANEINR